VADVLRYVSVARHALRGPLVLEIEGPGDPLASPETVLRALSLVHEHHPDVLTGLVIDGPLLAEYDEELEAFGLNYVALKIDAARVETATRLIDGAVYRGDLLERDEAARLYVEETRRAIHVARAADLPVAVRTRLIPVVNQWEIEEIASLAGRCGARRIDVLPHEPVEDAPVGRTGTPTAGELRAARETADRAFHASTHADPDAADLGWLDPERFQAVDLDRLEAVDVLRVLPDPYEDASPAKVLPRRRAMLVAVASGDGTLVDQTLGRANLLRVYAVTEDHIRFLGTRKLAENPRRRHDGVGDAGLFLRSLVGCRALAATHFSHRAITLCQAVGILPVAIGGAVDEVLDRIARGTVRQAT
jgi:nitrogen fixation protein NifB